MRWFLAIRSLWRNKDKIIYNEESLVNKLRKVRNICAALIKTPLKTEYKSVEIIKS
jgi:hypothetical protein